MNNGHSTGYFLLEGGTRRGDPISAKDVHTFSSLV